MENQLFTWKSWDRVADGDYIFYDCNLIVTVGKYPTGTNVTSIAMVYSKSIMEFYAEDTDSTEKTETFTPMKVISSFNLFLRAEEFNCEEYTPDFDIGGGT